MIFGFVEDFEAGSVFGEDLDGNNNNQIELTTIGKFEGQRSGLIRLTAENSFFEKGTQPIHRLYDENNITSPIYLELNYKNNVPFEIGVIGYDDNAFVDKVYITGMNASEEWNKIYINMTADVREMKADNYQIVIRAAKTEDVEVGEIFLDNVKLLHF